ncbi:MAG: putative cold shock-like protein [Pseudomonadota bacterium]
MAQGTVKWFNNSKGFGFIDAGDGGSDVFAHYSAIAMEGYKTLPQGATVTYELIEGPKGRHAQAIQLLSKPPKREEDEARFGRSKRLRTPQFRANLVQAREF